MRRSWKLVGWFGVATLVYLSLTPQPIQPFDMPQGDRVGHFLAYGVLMLWFAQVAEGPVQLVRTACCLVALGIALEAAQLLTPYRMFSYADMLANAIGVLAGLLLAPPRLPNILSLAERFNRIAGARSRAPRKST